MIDLIFVWLPVAIAVGIAFGFACGSQE